MPINNRMLVWPCLTLRCLCQYIMTGLSRMTNDFTDSWIDWSLKSVVHDVSHIIVISISTTVSSFEVLYVSPTCIVLSCIAWYCIMYRTVLCCIVLCCIVLFCIVWRRRQPARQSRSSDASPARDRNGISSSSPKKSTFRQDRGLQPRGRSWARVAEWLNGCPKSGWMAEWLLRFLEPCYTSTQQKWWRELMGI
jgi:uncharacterized membrane protein